MLNKIVLSCVCWAATLVPVWSAQAQEEIVQLPDLPCDMKPEKLKDLMALSAALNEPQSMRADDRSNQPRLDLQAEAGDKERQHQEEIRSQVYAMSKQSSCPCRVLVWLRNRKKLKGTITEVSSDSFLLRQKKKKTVTILYADIAKGPVLAPISSTQPGEGIALIFAAAALLYLQFRAYDETHR